MKNILIDVNHPAHVHFFKNFIIEIRKRNYNVVVSAKSLKSITQLLDAYNIPYIPMGKKKDGLVQKYLHELVRIYKIFKIVKKHKIDIGMGVSASVPLVSRITGMQSIGFDDDDLTATPVYAKIVSNANVLLTPDALAFEKREKQICYKGYQELSYLHPKRFSPNENVLTEIGLTKTDTFFILRFNAFKAHHDIGVKGLSLDEKKNLIDLLKPYGKIFITTEKEIEPELKEFQLKVPPEKIHSLLYYATMFIGDSQTMTTEAALLGTPALKLNSFAGKLAIPNEIEDKYDLCYAFQPGNYDGLVKKIKELLGRKNLKNEWLEKRNRLLIDKIDFTSFFVWFVDNYPQSVLTLKKDPEYQNIFK